MLTLVFFAAFTILFLWAMKRFGENAGPGASMFSSNLGDENKKTAYKPPKAYPFNSFHKSSLRRFAPYSVLFIALVILTAVVTKDVIAISLMVVGMAFGAAIVLYLMNRLEAERIAEEMEQEDVVRGELHKLDDFTIPDDWNRYL